MITIIRIALIRLIAGRRLQIALNLDGRVEVKNNGGPLYVGAGVRMWEKTPEEQE